MTVRFVFDQHVNGPASHALRAERIDVVRVAAGGLAGAEDAVVLRWARGEGRIVVTRNDRDFAPLVEALPARGESFAGVLFYATSGRHAAVGAHVRALSAWIAGAEAAGGNRVQDRFAWLR